MFTLEFHHLATSVSIFVRINQLIHGVAVFAHDPHAVAERGNQSAVGEIALLLFSREAYEECALLVGVRAVHTAAGDFGKL